MTRRWQTALAVLAFVAVAGIGVATAKFGRRLTFFRVRQVEVVGARYLDPRAVTRALGLRGDASTLDPLDGIRRAADTISGVLGATVERRFPGTLRVTVHEATPVALVPLADRVALIDSTGRILPFDPARTPTSLPLASRDSVTGRLLGQLMRVGPPWYPQIQSAHLERGDVVLDVGGRRIRLAPHASAAELRAVTAVLDYLTSHAMAWREIDARYTSRVFVQKGPA